MRLFAVALVTTGRLLAADDQTPPSSDDGYKTVSVDTGGKPIPVRVQEEKNPYAGVASPEENAKYDPERIFSRTSAMADKTFTGSVNFAGQGNTDYNKPSDRNTFVTKPYSFDTKSSSIPDANTKSEFGSTSAYSKSASGFGKAYPTSTADAGQNQAAALASTTAAEQGRAAVLGGPTPDTFASSFADKQFEGDEADAAKRHLSRNHNGQIVIDDLPSRPLTIDEVRQLINHGFKPDTDVQPEGEPAKPLNDPNYKPEPLRESPQPEAASAPATAPSDDDKDDPVPSPGMMSAPPAPENSQPLPQR
jgi:hypothetical protein